MEIYRCSPPESWRSAIEIPPYIRIFRKENKSNLLCFVYNLSISTYSIFHDVMDTFFPIRCLLQPDIYLFCWEFRARKDDDDGWAGRHLALGREHENHHHHHQVPRYITF